MFYRRNAFPSSKADASLDPRNRSRCFGFYDEGGNELVSAITRVSAESLALEAGTDVVAVIKSTEVLIGTA
ncbi:MAG: TOBE domain-containing protein [Gemmatimonadota bacterium]